MARVITPSGHNPSGLDLDTIQIHELVPEPSPKINAQSQENGKSMSVLMVSWEPTAGNGGYRLVRSVQLSPSIPTMGSNLRRRSYNLCRLSIFFITIFTEDSYISQRAVL